MSDELDKMTDSELSEVFAVEVAGFEKHRSEECYEIPIGFDVVRGTRPVVYWTNAKGDSVLDPTFAFNANAVLPWLVNTYGWDAYQEYDSKRIGVSIYVNKYHKSYFSFGETFPRAACIALIRATRAEPQPPKQQGA